MFGNVTFGEMRLEMLISGKNDSEMRLDSVEGLYWNCDGDEGEKDVDVMLTL